MINFINKIILKLRGLNFTFNKSIYFSSTNFGSIKNIKIKGNIFVNKFCSILAGKKSKIIFLGDCLIGPGTIITSANHSSKRKHKLFNQIWEEKDVIIGEEVWIGGNVTILPGVNIPKGCIIGANSVVTKSIVKEYSIVGGAPSKLIRMREF